MTAHATSNGMYILFAIVACSVLAALIKGVQLLYQRCAPESSSDTATLADGSSPSDVAVELDHADAERVFENHRREWSPMRSLQDLAAM